MRIASIKGTIVVEESSTIDACDVELINYVQGRMLLATLAIRRA